MLHSMSALLLAFITSVLGKTTPERSGGLLASECGRIHRTEPEVDGGDGTEFRQPWRVALYSINVLSSQTLDCGGTLISERFVLTSAHCVHGHHWYIMKVRLGDHGLEELKDSYPYEEYRIRRVIVHEDFETAGESRFVNDIALLELAEPVKFRKHILPSCLPQRNASFAGEAASVSAMGPFNFAQWSRTFSAQELDVQVADDVFCTTWLAAHGINMSHAETPLCASFKGVACEKKVIFDGSPLMLERNGRSQAIGLASWSGPCSISDKNAPTVFTNVTFHIDWIRMNLKVGPSLISEISIDKTELLYLLMFIFVLFLFCACFFSVCSSCQSS